MGPQNSAPAHFSDLTTARVRLKSNELQYIPDTKGKPCILMSRLIVGPPWLTTS